ncbi:hypothetical protein IHE35_12505 [Acinetobacter sp. ASP199]|nr:hypothetical protein IHE35_12505 [Acinetobacter sp. ASP199]
MTVKNISKYYYHEYVLIAFLLLMITACIAIFILDFTPTAIVKIGAIILATLLYFLMLIYFYILYRHGEWIIPRTWKNAQKRPIFYFFFMFPLFAICILYMNLVCYPPLLYTLMFGQPVVVSIDTVAIKKHGKKGSVSYFIDTPYATTRMFRLSADEYQRYQGQVLKMKLAVVQSHFGSHIKKIESIQSIETIQNK